MPKYNSGFTLAEVIITIAIVGLIASVTIPSLVSKIEKNENYTSLLKAYSILTETVDSIRASNNGHLGGLATNNSEMADLFNEKLKTTISCTDSSDSANCYNVSRIRNLQGTNYNGVANYLADYPKLVTTDGFVYTFIFASEQCEDGSYLRNGESEACGQVYVDVNGMKRPNTVGKDIFVYSVNRYNLMPYNYESGTVTACDESSGSATNGIECAARAISESKIDYY